MIAKAYGYICTLTDETQAVIFFNAGTLVSVNRDVTAPFLSPLRDVVQHCHRAVLVTAYASCRESMPFPSSVDVGQDHNY